MHCTIIRTTSVGKHGDMALCSAAPTDQSLIVSDDVAVHASNAIGSCGAMRRLPTPSLFGLLVMLLEECAYTGCGQQRLIH